MLDREAVKQDKQTAAKYLPRVLTGLALIALSTLIGEIPFMLWLAYAAAVLGLGLIVVNMVKLLLYLS